VGGLIVVNVNGSPSGSEHGMFSGVTVPWPTNWATSPHTGPLESRRSVAIRLGEMA
jgi:hypothetical protein